MQQNSLTVQKLAHEVLGNLLLPLVSIGQKLFLVVQQFFVCLCGKLVVGSLHNRIYRTGLLAKSAIDALGHVNVVPGGSAGTVLAGLGLDGNGLGGANGLAQLAGNAPLVTGGVSPQGVLSTESWTQVAPLVGVVDGDLGLETDLQGQTQSANDFREKENLGSSVKDGLPRSLKKVKRKKKREMSKFVFQKLVLVGDALAMVSMKTVLSLSLLVEINIDTELLSITLERKSKTYRKNIIVVNVWILGFCRSRSSGKRSKGIG